MLCWVDVIFDVDSLGGAGRSVVEPEEDASYLSGYPARKVKNRSANCASRISLWRAARVADTLGA